jgi:hypothetical protein
MSVGTMLFVPQMKLLWKVNHGPIDHNFLQTAVDH